MDPVFDVAIIGGGINGCGIAADAALRGLSTILIEKDDLASKTSSCSSKLIHGGLRYLEQYHFSLVRKALTERQRLLNLAPHLIRPIPFILPHQPTMRSHWLIRAGLFLYDYLSPNNHLPKSQAINITSHPFYFKPLKSHVQKSFIFYDCLTDDARLTISNALQAKAHGADIRVNTEITHAETKNNRWFLCLKTLNQEEKLIQAKVVVNATGPWVESTNQFLQLPNKYRVSLVKGSHFLIPKLFEGNQAYFLQHDDKRIVFVIPYNNYTMVGTTEVLVNHPLEKISISEEEINYLSHIVNYYFNVPIQKSSLITHWSGVRPLLGITDEKPQCLNRDYTFNMTLFPAPAVSIYGGKITTYRQLAVDVVNALKPCFPNLNPSLTASHSLPGAHLGKISYQEYLMYAHEKYHWLPLDIRNRYFSSYGTRTEQFLFNCKKINDLGHHFGLGLYEKEVDYLCDEEWASDCESILWRRTKLGICFPLENRQVLARYLANRQSTNLY